MSQDEVEELLGGSPGNYGRYSGDGWDFALKTERLQSVCEPAILEESGQ